jgi:hypothetical protein
MVVLRGISSSSNLGHSLFQMLATAIYGRFEELGNIEDLQEAITYYREALALCPPDHPDRSTSLNDLANTIFARLSSWESWRIWKMLSRTTFKLSLFNLLAIQVAPYLSITLRTPFPLALSSWERWRIWKSLSRILLFSLLVIHITPHLSVTSRSLFPLALSSWARSKIWPRLSRATLMLRIFCPPIILSI